MITYQITIYCCNGHEVIRHIRNHAEFKDIEKFIERECKNTDYFVKVQIVDDVP